MDMQEDRAAALYAHLKTGITTVCRCWLVRRKDGVTFGFTDHDSDLSFDGQTFSANSGMSAKALVQTTGLSVDNTEAVGALSSEAITEADILTGRYDGAEVSAWLVNWQNSEERLIEFRGTIGEVTRAGGAFQADLRGQTELLNQIQGSIYQAPCSAILGDARCKFNTLTPQYFTEVPIETVADDRAFGFTDLDGFTDRWFERGRLTVLTGAGQGLVGVIKNDRLSAEGREIELWQEMRAGLAPGDMIRLETGCDKSKGTCKKKFNNFINFRGFPNIPGEDWLMAYPKASETNDGEANKDDGSALGDLWNQLKNQ